LLLRRCCMFDLWMLCSDDLTGGEFLSTQDWMLHATWRRYCDGFFHHQRMAKKFFVNVFFWCCKRWLFTLHALFFDVAYIIFKCCKKFYMLYATFTHVAAGIFAAKLPSDARLGRPR
jgi:hypothetical protein